MRKPWKVAEVEIDFEEREVDVWIEWPPVPTDRKNFMGYSISFQKEEVRITALKSAKMMLTTPENQSAMNKTYI